MLPPNPSISLLVANATLLSLVFFAGSQSAAAPYPPEGMVTQWVQPDGAELKLRVFGDEFYARTETEAGYTVIFEPSAKTYYYAVKGPDGKALVSSKVPAGKQPPPGLAKHLEESPETIAAKRKQKIQEFAPNRAADWAARKKAVRKAQEKGTGNTPAKPSPAQSPAAPSQGKPSQPQNK